MLYLITRLETTGNPLNSMIKIVSSIAMKTGILAVCVYGVAGCSGLPEKKRSSKSIDEIVTEITKTNVLMGDAVGYGIERPEQWDRYEELRLRASDKELMALTSDTNGVVRCYAFQALANRKTADLFPVVRQHLADTALVKTLDGCLGGSQKVGDFFLETITFNKRAWKLNVDQKAVIDSLLIFENGNRLNARDKLLSAVEPEEKYYKRLRQLAIMENSRPAVVALSKYRRAQDKPLIEALLKDPYDQAYGFNSARNFPDRFFYPFLEQSLKSEVTKNNRGNDERLQLLYEAIVQYKDEASRKLLTLALSEAKDMQYIYHSDYLQMALKKYPAAIYEGIVNPVFTGVPKSNLSSNKR